MSNDHGRHDGTQDEHVEQTPTADNTSLALIEEQADKNIRRVWHEGQWYFSVIDVIGLLTESPRPRKYWNALKTDMQQKERWNELSPNLGQLKMTASDGKQRVTDAANTEALLRIIQSIPSPKAEPVKQWLARVGAEKLHQVTQPETTQPVTSPAQEIAHLRRNKPDEDAPALDWADYYATMSALYRRQAQYERQMRDVQAYLRYVESEIEEHGEQIGALHSRIESLEEGQRLLPELLERLGPQTLTPEHQSTVRQWVLRLHELTRWHFSTIYGDLNAAFHVARYSDLHERDWERITQWFKLRLEAAEKGERHK